MRRSHVRLATASAVAVVATCVLVSCTGPAEVAGGTKAADVNVFIDDVITGGRRYFSAGELEASLGTPLRTTRMLMQNDTVEVQQYYGIEVGVGRPPAGVRVMYMALTEPRYSAPEGLRVGYAEREVLRTLGPPSETASGSWTYTHEAARLLVYFENETVSRLVWRLE